MHLTPASCTSREISFLRMWEHCRKKCCGVIADVHVHPGGIGMYEYLGNADWQDHTAKGTSFIRLVKTR
ncbi:MAG: hypothetical protein ACLQFT_08175 [Steroidobacteraceae bacterium]|jgi:hypothetical protein